MFTIQNALDQLNAFFYYGAITVINEFQQYLGNMGTEIFDNPFIQAILMFFYWLANSLLVVGIILAVFEYCISLETGKASMKDMLFSILKGMAAANLFTTLPVTFYRFSVQVTGAITSVMNITQLDTALGTTSSTSTSSLVGDALSILNDLVINNPLVNPFGAIGVGVAPTPTNEQHVPTIVNLIFMMAFEYGFLKVLFGNIKRGGIILIQISVCSLYIFSLVRGYSDAFISWCKQIVALCFTTFLQNLMLVGGLLLFPHQMVAGVGLMLAAAEVPRIAQAFGLDTSTKANLAGISTTTSSVISLGRIIMAGGKA